MSLKTRKTLGLLSKSEPTSLEDAQQAGKDSIFNLIASMHLSSEYSDLTIVCKGRKFSVHKIIVCQRSEHLNGLCKNYEDPSKPLVINRDPTLIEKTLEFLYKADYTVPQQNAVSDFRAIKRAHIAKIREQQQASSPFIRHNLETEEDASPDIEGSVELDDQSQGISEEEDEEYEEVEENILHDDDPFIKKCHPSYFHARMYGEGDCFRIKDLKERAKIHFMKTFMEKPDAESFSRTIEEIYSTRAVYVELRTIALRLVVQNMKTLWSSILTTELIKSVPEFTSELLPHLLDMCDKKNLFVHFLDQKPAEVTIGTKKKTDISKRV